MPASGPPTAGSLGGEVRSQRIFQRSHFDYLDSTSSSNNSDVRASYLVEIERIHDLVNNVTRHDAARHFVTFAWRDLVRQIHEERSQRGNISCMLSLNIEGHG